MRSRAKGSRGTNRNVRYSKLSDQVDYRDEQFVERSPTVPVKSIALALLLFLIGSVMLTLAGLVMGGVFGETSELSATPLLILGLVTFIPGFYHVRLAYYAFRGYTGYSYLDIPHYSDD